ncbi:MAG: hypothetical protein KTR18_05865 [Acidiferrobacterales bacterium]|nr:hypothetical protein [Acidiferrobacterales bacterium]
MTNFGFKMVMLCISALFTTLATSMTMAGTADADVEQVRVVKSANGSWTFHVTVRHPDTGWDDYSNGWDVVTDTGEVLKAREDDQFTRVLFHPHETEQPFTRSQSGLNIPDSVKTVTVRAHDLVDGFGGKEVLINLDTQSGPGYTISE